MAMSSKVREAVLEDYSFEKGTESILKPLVEKHLHQIQAWLIMARKYIERKGSLEISESKYYVFKNTSDDTLNFSETFWESFKSNTDRGSRITSNLQRNAVRNFRIYGAKNNYLEGSRGAQDILKNKDIREMELIKSGYRLLTEVGELVRGGEPVRYLIKIDGPELGIHQDIVFNLSLTEFLQSGIGGKGIGMELSQAQQQSLLKLSQNKESVLATSKNINLDLDVYINHVKGHIQMMGRNNMIHDLSSNAAKIQGYYETIENSQKKDPFNKGHIFEALLSLMGVIAPWNVDSGRAHSGDASYWKALKASLKTAEPLLAQVVKTLENPAPFWQGGEGAGKEFLVNFQAKAAGAALTQLTTLVSEINRLYTVLRPLKERIYDKVTQKKEQQNYISDDEIVEKLKDIFDRTRLQAKMEIII